MMSPRRLASFYYCPDPPVTVTVTVGAAIQGPEGCRAGLRGGQAEEGRGGEQGQAGLGQGPGGGAQAGQGGAATGEGGEGRPRHREGQYLCIAILIALILTIQLCS